MFPARVPMSHAASDHPILPPRFAEALDAIRLASDRCEHAMIPSDSILAAVLAELMPRLVEAYGPRSVVSMLGDLAIHVGRNAEPVRH